MIFPKNNKVIKANYFFDNKTKHLITRLKSNSIAVINHPDIDEVAAHSLIEKKVKAVINFSDSITGKYPTYGLQKMLHGKIPVLDIMKNRDSFKDLMDGNEAIIDFSKNIVHFDVGNSTISFPVKGWNYHKWEETFNIANSNMENELNRFIDNTLSYASKEKHFVLKPLKIPPLKTKIKGKHVVVVVRGNNYREDLLAVRSYIDDYRPVLIGVDGGADALIEYGLSPDLIIGDMDSVSDKSLKSGAEIIVHAYPDGRAPGLERVHKIGIDSKVIASVGTSEDIAMLMAYEEQAEIIVALGAHSNMVDFLEKGRKGMASTVLVRMKIGTKLVDAKGVSKLYHPRVEFKALSLMGVAAITPIIAISMINHDMVRLLQMVWINIKMIFT